jgi:hypothetical protein
MVSASERAARGALPAAASLDAEVVGGQRLRERPLADAVRAADEERVGQGPGTDAIGEEAARAVVADDGGEPDSVAIVWTEGGTERGGRHGPGA